MQTQCLIQSRVTQTSESYMKSIFREPLLWLFASLTLGLAPFFPEPHIWEKIKWVFAGAEGMRPIDWFDLIMHGTPWVLLMYSLYYKFFSAKD